MELKVAMPVGDGTYTRERYRAKIGQGRKRTIVKAVAEPKSKL